MEIILVAAMGLIAILLAKFGPEIKRKFDELIEKLEGGIRAKVGDDYDFYKEAASEAVRYVRQSAEEDWTNEQKKQAAMDFANKILEMRGIDASEYQMVLSGLIESALYALKLYEAITGKDGETAKK